MSNLVRRLVSGNKARFKDAHLDMELDLVYVTDHIIIMGFPATGVEGLYRNRREDAKKFLDHRHGNNYWVFNFCPLRENSYPASFFDGRVSRYPFPDHHAPPLAALPLFVREARVWLSSSTDHVIVLHCKAGKGRSGTLACAYLLSLDESPSPPKLQRSMARKEWAKQRVYQIMNTVGTEEMDDDVAAIEEARVIEERGGPTPVPEHLNSRPLSVLAETGESEETITTRADGAIRSITGELTTTLPNISPPNSSGTDGIRNKEFKETKDQPPVKAKANRLEDVLTLHTFRRMKVPSAPDKKLKQGVSIPSQRRWLYYWSLLLAHAAPRDFWAAPLPHVRLLEIRVRLRELGRMKKNILKIANHLIEKTSMARSSAQDRGKGLVWVSLARYDDEFVDFLERWEKHTRSEDSNMGKRRSGAECTTDETLSDAFRDGKWDKGKMVRSFTRLGDIDGKSEKERSEDGYIVTHTLKPLSDQKWDILQEQLADSKSPGTSSPEARESLSAESTAMAASSSMSSITDINDAADEKGVTLDAGREVRAKIYLGQVFAGWFWFVPAFHMSPPPPMGAPDQQPASHFVLTRKEVDFPIGAGAALIDVDVAMEWVVPDADAVTGKPTEDTVTDERGLDEEKSW